MDFPVASSQLSKADLVKLGVKAQPQSAVAVDRICRNPPVDETTAGTLFSLMAGIITGISCHLSAETKCDIRLVYQI